MANYFDQFDAPQNQGNYFDRFDDPNYKDEKGVVQTVTERFKQGVETAGAGLSAGIGRAPDVVARDIADTQVQPSEEERNFQAQMRQSIETFDKDRSVGNFIGILGTLASNPKQALGEVAQSLGMSLPAYGGAAAGAGAGTLVGGPVGAVAGGIAGYLLGNLTTNVQAEIAGKLEEDLAKRGVDLSNPQAVTAALEADPTLISNARDVGAKKGAATTAAETAVDVATLGAGKFLKPATSIAGRLGRAAGVMTAQGVQEAAGSVAGSAAIGETVSPGQAVYEGLIGAVAGAPEGVGMLRAGQELSRDRGPAPEVNPGPTAGEIVNSIGAARTVDEAIAIAADLVDQGRLVTDDKLRATQDFMRSQAEDAATRMREIDFEAARAQAGGPAPISTSEAFARSEQALANEKARQEQELLRAGPLQDAEATGETPLQGAAAPTEGVDASEAPKTAQEGSSPAVGAAMQGMLDRLAGKFEADPTRVTTSELAFLARHHPDEAIQSAAETLAGQRRNAAVFTDAIKDRPLALPAPEGVRGPGTVYVSGTGEAGTNLPAVETRAAINRNASQLTDEAKAELEKKRAENTEYEALGITPESPFDMSTVRGRKRAENDSVLAEPAQPVDQSVVAALNEGLNRERDAAESQVDMVAVEPLQLPVDRHTHKDGSTTISQAEARDIENLARVYGKTAVFVEDVNGNGPEGAVVDSDDKHIFVAVRSKAAHQLVIAAHEIAHHMERDEPELHAELVRGLVGDTGAVTEESPLVEFYRYYHNKPGMPGAKIVKRLSDPGAMNKLINEFVADVFGNRHAELKTHQMLFNAAKRVNDPSLIHRIANFIIGYIDRLLERVKLRKFATDNLVKDLTRTRKLVREVATEYAVRQQGKTRLQAEADAIQARKPKQRVDKNGIRILESKERAAGDQFDLHLLDIQRAERFADKTGVSISKKEDAAIKAAAKKFGVDEKRIRATVLGYKADNPESQGWAPLEFSGLVQSGKAAVKYRYVTQPYTFSDDANGRALDPTSEQYQTRVEDVSNKMVEEVRSVFERAKAGDKNAEVMIRQAGWYANMRVRLRQEFGGLGDLFADSLGATSPNTPVRDNLASSIEVLRRASRGDYDAQIDALEQWVDRNDQFDADFRAWFDEQLSEGKTKKEIKESVEYKEAIRTARELRDLPEELKPTKESGKLFGVNSTHVARALVNMWRTIKAEDPDIGVGASAPKAINFSGNLIGYREGATIDVWAARMLQRLTGGLRAPVLAEDGVSGNMLPSGKTTLQFGFGQDVFSAAAEKIRNDPEMSTNPVLRQMNPDDLQAVVWFLEKEVWAKNNWTSVAGEGGSFEAEAGLTGSSDQTRIRELRKIIDAKNTKPADRLAALEELKSFQRPVDRMIGGLSIQQSVDTQGVDYVPSDKAMAKLAKALKAAIYEVDDGLTVLGAKVLSTVGRYGGEERSIDIEVVARENFDPNPLMLEMLKQAQAAKQDSMFLSRVLPMTQEYDPLVHRPGIEIYFREQGSLDKVEPLLKALGSAGVDMYTVIVDGRQSSLARSGATPAVVGVRFQYVPEFDVRYGGDIPKSDSEIQSKMEAERERLNDMAQQLSKLDGVSFAGQFWYETDVRFLNEYQGAIDALASRSPAAVDRSAGGKTWSGRSVREGLEAAAQQRDAADARQAADAASRDAGKPAVQRSAARGGLGEGIAGPRRGDRASGSPSVDEEGRVTLDHWSTARGLTALDPNRHGSGLAGAESRRKRDDPDNWVNRTYFGIRGGGYQKETGLGPNHYEVQMPLERLYDFAADPDGLRPKTVGGWDNPVSVYERKIKDAGYAGYWVNNASLGQVAAVYVPTVPREMIPQVTKSQVRAATANPVFQKWFGNSKMVGKDGLPEVWYHGTARDITQFKPKQANAIFVTRSPEFATSFANASRAWIKENEPPVLSDEEIDDLKERAREAAIDDGFGPRHKLHEQAAEEYFWEFEDEMLAGLANGAQNLIPLLVKAEKPFIYTAAADVDAVLDQLYADQDRVTIRTAGKTGGAFSYNREEMEQLLSMGAWGAIESEEVQIAIRELGYDAFTVSEGGQLNLAVYSSNQLKSVFNKKPTSNPRIDRSTRRAQIDTPEFKQWFGGSKAVIEVNADTGKLVVSSREPKRIEPMVLYHTTSHDFDAFESARPSITSTTFADVETRRHAMFFTPSVEDSNAYGRGGESDRTVPVYLKAERPLDLTSGVSVEDEERLLAAGMSPRYIANQLGDWGMFDDENGADVVAMIRDAGFDSVIFNDENPITRDTFEAWAVFEPTQIKSAIGNSGEFSPTNPRIDRSTQRANYLGVLTQAQEAALKVAGAITQPMTVGQQMQTWKANLGLRMAQGMVDQFRAIKDVDAKAYTLARLSKGTDGMLEAMFLYGKPYLRDGIGDVRVNPNGGFARVLASLDGEHGRFIWWVAALRAERLKAEGRENLLTDSDISELKTLNANDPEHPERAKKFRDALDSLNDYNRAVLNIARDSGLIDDEGYDLMKDQPYVPFYRVMEDGVQGPGFGSGLTRQYFSKKLKGGKEAINQDLLQNMLLNWSHVFEAAAKNRAAKAAISAAEQLGVAYPVASGTKGATAIREQGVEKHYMIEDPYLFEAISAVNYSSPSWYKPFSTVKRWLTIGVTANPAFKIRNLIRDSVQAIATSELGFNPLGNVKAGFTATNRKSQTYASMLAGGGMMRFGTIENSAHAEQLVKKELRDAGKVLDEGGFKKLADQISGLWETYGEFGDRLENVNRAALYEQLIAKGYDHAEASFMARDLMDFSMSGRWPVIRFLAQAVPFMNARLQGLYKLGRAAKEDPVKLGVVSTAVIMASMALLFAYGDDDDWKKREDWDRDNYWWFKIGGTAFRIPKPFELGALGTLVERTWELGFDKEMDLKRYGKQLSNLFFEQFSMSPVPQLVKPLFDIYANQDAFTGRPIESQGMERLRPQDRMRAGTSSVARFLGQLGLPDPSQLAMGRYSPLSPVQIDYLVRGYSGWVGATATTALDYGMRPLQDRGEKPEMQLRDVFLLGSFVESLPTGSSRYVTQMYEQAREVSQVYASWREAVKAGDVTKARDIAETEREKMAKYRRLTRASDALGELSTQIKRIEESKTLSAETKRRMIDRLRAQQDRLAQQTVSP